MRFALLASLSLASSLSFCQDTLSLDQALQLALERNGDVRAAALNAKGAGEATKQAFASFLPTITPAYQYLSNRQSVKVPGGKVFNQTEGGTSTATFNWTVLDAGERSFTLRSSKFSQYSSEATAVQTLRNTLYNVFSQYVEALRAQESLKVNSAQVERAQKILEQTRVRVKAGDEAGKEVLQAQADELNAQYNLVTAKQATATTLASLKGTIGIPATDVSPQLGALSDPSTETPAELPATLAYGVEHRPDLASARLNIQSLRYLKMRADRLSGPTFSLTTSWAQTLTPTSLENRTLTFLVSTPLFDGGLTRAQARQALYSLQASEALYTQQERSAKAEIETAHSLVIQNVERLRAARAALEAAQLNYKASVEAQRLGAATVIDVLTARVSLATSENNLIQAKFDALLAERRLALVTGRPMFPQVGA